MRRNVPGHEFRKLTIKERHSHLDRASHTHRVVVGQIEAGHENLGVQIEHLVEEISVSHGIEILLMTALGIMIRNLRSQVPRINAGTLIGIEISAICNESTAWIQGCATQHLLYEPHRAFEP